MGASPKKKARTTTPALFRVPSDYVTYVFPLTSGLGKWLEAYQKITEFTADTRLATSVIQQVTRFWDQLDREGYHTITREPLSDVHVFGETLDAYIDDQVTSVQLSTVVQRLRYIRWAVCYRLNTDNRTDPQILIELDDTITSMQPVATIRTTNTSLLTVLDPYRLVGLHNRIVSGLKKLQTVEIDPFIQGFFVQEHQGPTAESVRFGLRLRCFVELLMRFNNVPLRVECSRYLQTQEFQGTDFVAKLVCRKDGWYRLVNQDKTGKISQNTLVPLDSVTSGYLHFYLRYCRRQPSSTTVFQSASGGVWSTISKDLKTFLSECGVDSEQVAQNGRLIHGTRHIGLAVFSVLSDFNIEKIRNYATLLRHQLVHVEKIYSPWLRMYQQQQAAAEMLRLKGLGTLETKTRVQTEVHHVRDCHPVVYSCLKQLHESVFMGPTTEVPVRYTTRDMGTQTGDQDLEPQALAAPGEPQRCLVCDSPTSVFGPLGDSKNSKRFGCYWRQCAKCHGSKHNKESFWYPLGVTPKLASSSTRPRNLSMIQVHIEKNKKVEAI